MEYRPLDLTIISAKDLKDVNLISKMDVYAIATLTNDPRSKQRTPTDKEGGKNPTWNFPIKFSIPITTNPSPLILHIQLKSDRSLGDRDIGEVHIPVKELLSSAADGSGPPQFVTYQVRKPSGKPKGTLNLSYKIGDKAVMPAVTAPKSDQPVMAYPAAVPGPSAAGGYPPPGAYPYPPPPQQPPAAYPAAYPAAGYGYGAPPQQGYGYGAPPQQGYGYGYGPPPPQVVAPPPQQVKKNKFGMGLGAGLLGGALGGLLIGDMISDSNDYGGGFDDGGFDF